MRRYLEAVFGNRESCLSLGKSIERNTLSHAILIEGDEGSGKRTLAKQIAKACLCEGRKDPSLPLPCCECRACHLVENGLAPDVHSITRGDRATLGVEAVRDMIEDTAMASTEFDQRFYIFEDAHTMTAQAQNALLKVMEEPPEGVILLLLTESADSMLTTVRSRARLLRMQRFTPEEMSSYFSERHPSLLASFSGRKEELDGILLFAGGSIGKAKEFLSDQSGSEALKDRNVTLKLLEAVSKKSFSAIREALFSLPQKREDLREALALFHSALRDLILLQCTEHPPLVFFPNAEAVPEQASALRLGTLYAFSDAILQATNDLERNANVQTALTVLASHLRYAQKER